MRINNRSVGSSSTCSLKERPTLILLHPSPALQITLKRSDDDDSESRRPRSHSSDVVDVVFASPPQHTTGPPARPSHPPASPPFIQTPYHGALQPHHSIGTPFLYRLAAPAVASPIVDPPPIISPLHHPRYAPPLDETPVVEYPAALSPNWCSQATSPQQPYPSTSPFAVPPPLAQAPQHYSPPAPFHPPSPQHDSSPRPSRVECSTSDMPFTGLHLRRHPPPRYPARQAVDQWALSAFRLAL